MTQDNLAKNTTFFTGALAMQKLLSFVYFIFVARFIGVVNMGKFSFALSFTTIFAMFLDFGLSQILIRESARDKNSSRQYLASIIALKLIGSVVVYGFVILMINWLGYPAITKQLVYVSGIVMLLDSFTLSFFSILRGHQNLRYESYSVVLNQLIVLVFGLIVLKLNFGLVALIGVYLIGSLFNFFYAAALLKIKLGIVPQIDWNWLLIKKILKLALPFAIAGFFIRLYSSIDIILLSKLVNDQAVGLYSVAYKITFALQFIAVAFSASIYPAFCDYFINSREKLAKTFVKSMYYLMMLSLPISVGVITLADKMIRPVFGAEYVDSVLTLQILISALVLVFLCFPVGAMLNASNRQTRQTINLGLVALFNIILNLILIPVFSQAGAAIAALISYVLLFTLGIVVVEKIVQYDKKYLLISLAKIIFSCLVMGLVVLVLKNYWHFILVSGFGVLVYLTVLYLIKGWTKNDFIPIKSLLCKRE